MQAQEEMRQKMEIIREIRAMEATSAARQPKLVDLTEIPGYGLLCEMSVAEVCHSLIVCEHVCCGDTVL